MIALGKPKGEKEDDEEEDDVLAADEDLVTAAKAVRTAKSDEDYAKALKGFIKLCGGY